MKEPALTESLQDRIIRRALLVIPGIMLATAVLFGCDNNELFADEPPAKEAPSS